LAAPIAWIACVDFGRPLAAGQVISRHATSAGTVAYRQCSCGRLTVETLDRSRVVLGGVHPANRLPPGIRSTDSADGISPRNRRQRSRQRLARVYDLAVGILTGKAPTR
jgi:hypothetical protein